ncbi:MAG: Uma2 family endonuclease [Lachnospiraceae bacterium]
MNGNLAYQEEPREELLGGRIYMMSSPTVNHSQIASNIYYAFRSYLKGKTCRPFNDGVDVYLTENDRVIPDAMIVCNKNIIRLDGIHGAPDLVVEVLSPGTAKNDRGYKKNLYETAGVKEYWIVDPISHSIEVYILANGKFVLDEVYALYPAGAGVTDEEREETKKEIQVSLYNDFCISLEEIFKDLF